MAIGIKIIKHRADITGKSLAGGSYHFQFKFITGVYGSHIVMIIHLLYYHVL